MLKMCIRDRGVDPEKFMAYIRSKTTGEGIYYLLLDEIQMLDCFEAVSYTHLDVYKRQVCGEPGTGVGTCHTDRGQRPVHRRLRRL